MGAWVDDPRWARGKIASGHLIADSLDTLHAVAAAAGIDRKWFQALAPVPHYTLLVTHRDAAIDAGAIPLDRAAFTRKLQPVHDALEAERRRSEKPARSPEGPKAPAHPAPIEPSISATQLSLL